jgi:hypothetical protein
MSSISAMRSVNRQRPSLRFDPVRHVTSPHSFGWLPRAPGQVPRPELMDRLGELFDRLLHDLGDRQQ